jgi:uncharacterized membrane protein YkgB
MPKKLTASTFLILSAVAAAFVGILVFFGVRKVDMALIAAGVAFIVSLVGIATLALMVPEQNNDPNSPLMK